MPPLQVSITHYATSSYNSGNPEQAPNSGETYDKFDVPTYVCMCVCRRPGVYHFAWKMLKTTSLESKRLHSYYVLL